MGMLRFGSKFKKFLKIYHLPEAEILKNDRLSEFFLRIAECEEDEKDQIKYHIFDSEIEIDDFDIDDFEMHHGSTDDENAYGALNLLRGFE